MFKKEELVQELIRSRKRLKFFRDIPQNIQGSVILKLPPKITKQILSELNDEEILHFIKFLDLDEAADVLQSLDVTRSRQIISRLEKETREKIELLLMFDKESAAGLMTLDYVQVDCTSTISKALRVAEKHEAKTGKFPVILVTKDNSLVGELPTHLFAKLQRKNDKVSKHYRKVPAVHYNQDVKELPRILQEHSHDKIVVVDEEDSILGLLYPHDILKRINESTSLTNFAGVSKEEDVYDSFSQKAKSRYRWLILNLATAFLAASVVGLFENTISKFVLLAVYMPVVAGMGGNAGTQTLAVFVRGIALKEIELSTKAIKAIVNEILAGAMNGLITGVLASVIALLWNKSAMLGLVIGLAMVINLVIAGFFGAIVPLMMKKLGKDPATSATIFITTATDVFGFFAFLGLATILLSV